MQKERASFGGNPSGRVVKIDIDICAANAVGKLRGGSVRAIYIRGIRAGEIIREIDTDETSVDCRMIRVSHNGGCRLGCGVVGGTSCGNYRSREDKEINKLSHIACDFELRHKSTAFMRYEQEKSLDRFDHQDYQNSQHLKKGAGYA